MLHIVNGDSVADKLKQGDIQGDILVWREVYPLGPVFSDMAYGNNRLIRAQHLEQSLGIPQMEYIKSSDTQDKILQDFKELMLGSKVWEAYTSQELGKHVQILDEDISALPFVRDAFAAHLSRLPSSHNGLGIVEQTTLELVAGGLHTPYELLKQTGNKLNTLGMGDLEYWYYLAKMSEEPYPLLHIQGLLAFPNFKNPVPTFRESIITLTELGQKVLVDQEDWATLKGVDRWFGGFRLQDKAMPWRWDASQKTVIKM